MTSYTPDQAAAIGCLDRPLQIIACAGSGKTQVISQRIARILAQDGVEPRNVCSPTSPRGCSSTATARSPG